MKRHISLAPFALNCDGRLVLNMAAFDGPIHPMALLERALLEPGSLFIGVELSAVEAAVAKDWLQDSLKEAAAYAVGARQRQQRRGDRQR